MKVTLDVSAAFCVVTQSKGFETFAEKLKHADTVSAPGLFISEASNTAWKYHKIQQVAPEKCQRMASRAISLLDKLIEAKQIWPKALELAIQHNITVYDAMYLAVALEEQSELLSLDRRLMEVWAKVS